MLHSEPVPKGTSSRLPLRMMQWFQRLSGSLVRSNSSYGLRLSSSHSILMVWSPHPYPPRTFVHCESEDSLFFPFECIQHSTRNRWEKGHLLAVIQHHRNLVVTESYITSLSYVTFAGGNFCYGVSKNVWYIERISKGTMSDSSVKKGCFSREIKNTLFLQSPSSPHSNKPCTLKLDQIEGLGKHQLHFYADLPVHPSQNAFSCLFDTNKTGFDRT